MDTPLSEHFVTRRMKMLSRPDGFMLYGKLGIDAFSTSELLYPSIQITLGLIRARPNFYMTSGIPNVSLGIIDCSFYARSIALKDDHHKKNIRHACIYSCRIQLYGDPSKDFYHSPPPPPTKPFYSRKHIKRLQFVKVALQWLQTLHLLDRNLEIQSGTNNLISGKLECSWEVSQL